MGRLFSALLPLGLAAAALGQEASPPTAAELLEQLQQAHRAATLEARLEPLAAAAAIPDEKVARAVAKFVVDPVEKVRLEAVRALRYMRHSEALDQLIRLARSRDVRKDAKLHGEILLALGQHGQPRAISAIMEHLSSSYGGGLAAKRITALTHIRNKASIEALIKMAQAHRRGRVGGNRKQVNEAIYLLSGKRFGNQADLLDWWNAARRSREFKVSEDPTWLNKKERAQWERAWMTPAEREQRASEEQRERAARKERRKKGKDRGAARP